MAKMITLKGYRCERCGHEWLPMDKKKVPKACAKCKSAYFDRPRKKKN